LLVVTDHRFFQRDGAVYDAYCFDRRFFDDYKAHFAEVRVLARIRREPPPAGARRADGDGIRFVSAEDSRGIQWGLRSWFPGPKVAASAAWADAVCVRIPSVLGWNAYRAARRGAKPQRLAPSAFLLARGPRLAADTTG
jgi:hypothetical protein